MQVNTAIQQSSALLTQSEAVCFKEYANINIYDCNIAITQGAQTSRTKNFILFKKSKFEQSIYNIVPGGENGNLLQHSSLENLLDRGPWWATVHGVAKSHKEVALD